MNHTSFLSSRVGSSSSKFQVNDFLGSVLSIQLLVTGLVLIFIAFSAFTNRQTINAPYVGYRVWFEPTFLVRLRFVRNARGIISQGYKQFKNGLFVIRRNDVDIVVLSNKYLDELRLLPNTKLSSVEAQVKNLLGKYTYTLVMLESNLHVRVLQNRLTPKLDTYLDRANSELRFSLDTDVPRPEEWTTVDIQAIVRTIVSRMSAVVFLGFPTCRNEDWLKLSVDFSVNVFKTTFTMRMFPAFMHPIVALLLPARKRVRENLNVAEKIIMLIVKEHQDWRTKGKLAMDDTEDDSLLFWMLSNATAEEGRPDKMASRQLILTLASIHTTSMAVSHALYDLCEHPELFEPLLEEIETVLAGKDLEKEHLSRLEKLDSFLMESQRFNPPILLSPQRLALEPITLRDGNYIPKGTRVAFASADILMDPVVTSNAEVFDPFRSYNKRKVHGESNRHTMGQTDKNHLSFGHGKQACPGRMFAVAEIKMILAHFLMEWEFKFPKGKKRPKNFFLDENIFPDPSAKLMLRKKAVN